MNLKFTEEYYPRFDELTPEQVSTAREKVVAELQPVLPDIDLAPGSATGDFVVSPLAAYRAVAEEANSRLMSDLDLANVADGLIYSCAFVEAYLGNFAVYDVENLTGFGMVRLSYSSGAARTIPRTSRYRFGTSDDWSLKVASDEVSEINILSAGSSHTGAPDTYILAQTSSTTWAVDLPLSGNLTQPVSAGTSGTGTEVSDDLVGIASAIDFLSGLPSASLSELAKMARKVAFSLTAGSRASTKALIYRNWPETNMASPCIPGDAELQRVADGAPMALQPPAADVYFRSSRDMQVETQSIRLDYVLPAGAAQKVFRGPLTTLHRPSRIRSVEWSGTTDTSLVSSRVIYSKSGRADLYGSLHCGTRHETLYAEVVPTTDEFDIPSVPLMDDGNGNQYAIFEVVYDCDPLLETVSSLLESPDYRPAGVDVLVKSGPLLLIGELKVYYTKQQGTQTTLSVARDKIVEYTRTSGHPEAFRQTEIHDIMRNAGAERVIDVAASGHIFVSAADRLMRASLVFPDGYDKLDDWDAQSDPFQLVSVPTIGAVMVPNTIVDGEISAGGPLDAWAATTRTCRHYVDPDSVIFIEI